MAGFIHYLSGLIKNWGYIGILTTVGMEYACFPISSEILLPFIGYSVYLGELSLPLAIIFSTVGGIFGSSFCYGVGRFGRNVLKKISKNRFLAMKEGIKRAEVYFVKIGKNSVFFGRFMPIVRTYISFPAGMTKMKYSTFLLYSSAGALLWNTFLISCGYYLGEHWQNIGDYFSRNKFSISFLVLFVAGLIFVTKRKRCK